jgi:VWFA-related protein
MQNFSRRTLLGMLAGCCLSVSLPGDQDRDPFTITDNVNLVLLDVSVKDKAGGYVSGLTKADFQVFDSGHSAPINHFASEDSPVTVGLILDDSGSMRPKRPGVVLAGLAFAKESNPKDEFFVVNFNDHVAPGLPPQVAFTDNINLLHQALYMGQPEGKTSLYDAIALGLRHLERGHHEKRTLIVVSDGGDNASHLSQAGVMALIQESRATIYTVGLIDPYDSDLNPGVLRRMANISGGQYFEPRQMDEVIPVLRKISKDIRNRYTLGFTPQLEKNEGSLHPIRVVAKQEGRKLIVRTRSSYSMANE